MCYKYPSSNPQRGRRTCDMSNFLILVALLSILLVIRLVRRNSRRQKPELPDLLRSRLLKAKIVSRSM